MIDEKDRLLEELARLRPTHTPTAGEWAESDRAEELLRGVIEEGRSQTIRRRPARRRFGFVLAGAGAAVVVVVAVLLSTLYLSDGKEPVETVQTATTTFSASGTVTDPVSVKVALERVIALSGLTPGGPTYENPTTTLGAASNLLGEADALGLLAVDPGLDPLEAEPITRGRYALWLWTVFGSYLPGGQADAFTDIAQIPQDVRTAVLGLSAAGIVSADSDGGFHPDRALSEAEQGAIETLIMQVFLG